MNKKNNMIDLIPVVLGIILTAGVMSVFSACGPKEDGTWMRCRAVQEYVAVCGGCITVFFALGAFFKRKMIKLATYVLAGVGSVVAFVLPGIAMPMCMMHTMRCYTVMQPFVRIMAVILAACAVVGVVRELRKKGFSQP